MSQAPGLKSMLRGLDELSGWRLTLGDDILIDTTTAAEILGIKPDTLRKYHERSKFHPWLIPALDITRDGWPRARLYWRHRIEELTRLRKENPAPGGPIPWELPTDG